MASWLLEWFLSLRLTLFLHSSCEFSLSNYLLWASSASMLLEVNGVDSPRLLHSSRSYCFNLRMVDVYLWSSPLAGNALLLFMSWLSILRLFLYFGLQYRKFT
jgi:hypothetical protein